MNVNVISESRSIHSMVRIKCQISFRDYFVIVSKSNEISGTRHFEYWPILLSRRPADYHRAAQHHRRETSLEINYHVCVFPCRRFKAY